MGETTQEGAIPPIGSVPEGKRPGLLSRLLHRTPKEVKAPDIAPVAVQATDFVPAAAAIETNTSPVNAAAPEFATPRAQIDTPALGVQKDLTAQMTAEVTAPFPGARPPEVASGFTAPTNPPTETATVPPIVAGSEIVTPPTPINAEAATGTLTGSGPVEEKPEAA